MDLSAEIYRITSKLPQHELYGLKSQMQRCSVSIPSNIAEGSKRGSRLDFRQFCIISLGSAAELETQLLIVQKQYAHITVSNALKQVTEVQKMLTVLVSRLKLKV